MSDVVLKVEGLSKKFCKSLKRSMLYGTNDVVRDMFGFPQNKSELRKDEFWALQDINFELKRGETLGLIGQNGCGKSTLLRLINGIFPPDKGKISINGRIGALIAVGAGFHPHMSGRENIYLNGTILGMTKAELKQKFDAIVDFAEIGDFIDSPVATYSSGMTVRLGFAIAIHCEPDILLIDEILAVGDAKFQRKCLNKIKDLRDKNNVSFILVSHNLQNIDAMCSQILFLDKGIQLYCDTSEVVIPKYELLLMEKDKVKIENNTLDFDDSNNKLTLIYNCSNWGTDEINIKNLQIIKNDGTITNELLSNEAFSVVFNFYSKQELNDVYFLFRIYYTTDNYKNVISVKIFSAKKYCIFCAKRNITSAYT